MTEKATALVQTGARKLEFQELPLPDLPEGAVLIRVEANGICASDLESYDYHDPDFFGMGERRLPRVLGHEIVGVIERMGPPTASRAGLKIGDRVGVNPKISCGQCSQCQAGQLANCVSWRYPHATYGFIPTWVGPGLWGGYSSHVYADPRTVLYPFPESVDPLLATLWNPLAGAIQWVVRDGGLRFGSSVAILGCGQRGLSAALVAQAAGASKILITGLSKDAHKLALAREFGAEAVDIEHQDVRQVGAELTNGEGFDLVVDTTPLATQPIHDAIELVRRGGRISSVGIKVKGVPDFPLDRVTVKGITLVGGRAPSHASYLDSSRAIIENRYPIARLRTHRFGFDQLDEAMATLRDEDGSRKSINVVVTPTTD